MGNNAKGFEFKKFATPRIIGGIAIAVIVLWALSIIFGSPDKPASTRMAGQSHETTTAAERSGTAHRAATPVDTHPAAATTTSHTEPADAHEAADTHETTNKQTAADTHGSTDGGSKENGAPDAHATTDTHASTGQDQATSHQPASHAQPSAAAHTEQATEHSPALQTAAKAATSDRHPLPTVVVHKPTPRGVAFVAAAIKPMHFELEERWWGWRPNDLIEITDNVNHFQLGVLEVTRRTVVALAEKISRTGVTDALDPHLEEAMNWFMVKASSYWFPSAESKYRDGLEEMQSYLENLKAGKATFYIRSDNLIPLLASFEDLLGSCDENLVKHINEDGTPVSFFAADNFFFYTRGVAKSMATVLEAVHHDFLLTLESRNATELLHHAVVSCQQAAAIDPWIILDRNLSSTFANHRANMAAPISHARFYLGQLIKTLST